MSSTLSSLRIASTAAWSADFSSPRPTQSAEQTAARSVTRPISSASMRFRLGVFAVIGIPIFFVRVVRTHYIPVSSAELPVFNSNDERRPRYILVFRQMCPRAGHRALVRLMRDEDDRQPAAAVAAPLLAALHDALDGNGGLRQRPRDLGHAARPVDRAQPQVERALVRVERRLRGRLELRGRH